MVTPVLFSACGGIAAALETDGGIDGKVLRVTTLAASGPGSLRSALEAREPRLIVFEVGGVIDLEGRTLVVRHPHVTVAGQTAPDPGITLIRGGLIVETHDVVIQHIAVRPGDGEKKFERWSPDALGVRRGESGPAHHVVFDHCSATWGIDENLSVSGPADAEGPEVTAHDVTIRHCLIAEALSRSTHPKGEHSKGTLVHDGVRNVVILNSVFAHNRDRNPRLKGGTTAVIAGNVMYNWGSACIGVGARGDRKILRPAEAAIVGNTAIPGPDTKGRVFVKSVDPGARVFLRDNAVDLPLADDGVVQLSTPAFAIPSFAPASEVLRNAGSRPARRDPIDARIIDSITRRTGRIIDSQEEVGGYPVRAQTKREIKVPENIEKRRAWLDRLSRIPDKASDVGLAVE